MANRNFLLTTQNILETNNNEYTSARYAPEGNSTVGKPFPLYKQSGKYFTDWQPSGNRESALKQEFNLPLNNTYFRNSLQAAGVGLVNSELSSWQNRTQTLTNNGSTLSCATDADCDYWPGTKCNSNFMTWDKAKGNQTNYCSYTVYPELKDSDTGVPKGITGGGVYHRKSAQEGGIGKKCETNNDCSKDYYCNNETTSQGSNIQQTGYCAMKYKCPGGSEEFLGTPYNSGIPQPPPNSQNNNGEGYLTKQQCENVASGQQDCISNQDGKWYAVYPGFCPIPNYLRDGSDPKGNVYMSNVRTVDKGFTIPQYSTNNSSTMGSNQSLDGFNAYDLTDIQSGSVEASRYSLAIDPPPANLMM